MDCVAASKSADLDMPDSCKGLWLYAVRLFMSRPDGIVVSSTCTDLPQQRVICVLWLFSR